MSLYAKRLERGRFIWPSPADGIVAISAAQLAYMLDGIDWRNPVRTWRPEVAGLSSPSAAAMWDNRARDDNARGSPRRHNRVIARDESHYAMRVIGWTSISGVRRFSVSTKRP